jgi:hypothetical protein
VTPGKAGDMLAIACLTTTEKQCCSDDTSQHILASLRTLMQGVGNAIDTRGRTR